MGDHRVLSQPNGLILNGLLPEKSAIVSQVLDTERWHQAEQQTAELIARIQPNPSSEDRRNAVANYVERLIMKCLSCRVFTFGSVPLKTYLPDGDIDLTAFSDNENLKDTWATTVCGALENEEKSENAEFRVKEVKYIQAEVKLIKCLVENIVVDISFNQVGGLCTLCFLEEMDKVINRNHLFKRSIILIKAWCYYESRILGAHHGLISTYALETLVLYIFHVFNNSFAGPLEVLYRFLQFFSNFDWGNYCISLWGPVPISSLPDMNAEPPRRDNGDLLFSKSFLDKCTAVYSVMPGGQENHIQPFLSKHFNVVDPLRTNNNLGRSVSKGNFFRIRTAFAYGAKRLARLLECPKDAITAEVNLFFMNTWTRDGAGDRPDVLNLNSQPLQPVESVQVDESNNSKRRTGVKRFENGVSDIGEENPTETGQSSHYFFTDTHGNNENVYRLNNFPAVTHAQNHISYKKQINSSSTDLPERSHSSSGPVPSDKNKKGLKPNYSSQNDQEEQGRLTFARTRSSPELSETSFDLARGRHGRTVETAKVQGTTKLDSSVRKKNMVSEITSNYSSNSSLDGYSSIRQASSQKNLDVSSNANSAMNCHQGDFGFTNMREELASVSETLEMQQEQQDLVNMMGTSNIHSFNGQVPFPMHVAPYHLPLALSPVSTSMGYVKRNLARVLPSNLPIIGAPWGSNMQFAQGLTSLPLSHYFCAAPYGSNIDAAMESSNDGSPSTELNLEDNDQGNWHEEVLSRGSNPGVSGPPDGKQQKVEGNLTSSPTERGTNTGSFSRGYNKLSREDRTSTREDLNSSFQSKTGRAGDAHSTLRSTNSKYCPPLQASSSRSKSTSENLRDRSSTNKSPRDRWGRKPVPPVSTSTSVKENSKLQLEASSDNVSSEVDDDNSGWIPLSTMGNDVPERITESASLSSPHARNQHSPGYELVQNQTDSLIPFAPLLVGASQQRAIDYSKLFTAFVPTGPPVPFWVIPPTFGNFTPNTGNPDGYARQFDREEESDQFKVSSSDQNIDSADSLDQSEAVMSPTVSRNSAPESSEEPSSDILNSDLNGHRENLVYGRFCQNPYYHGSFMYSPPVVGSPIYLSGHYQWDGHVRASSANLNYTQITSPQMLPVMQLPSGPDRASGVFQRNVDEAPRYRGGTGTYLPNPKASFRDRQSSSRNHRGNRSYDRNDPGDRQRPSDRSHGRNQAEKAGFRPDRSPAAKNQEEKRWNSYKHEPLASYQGANHAFASTNSSHNLDSAFGLYSQTTFSSNGGVPPDPQIPPVVLVYPFDQGVADGSSTTEPLEFGSLRAVHPPPPIGNGAPRAGDAITEGEPSDQRHSSYYRGGSTRSSPDQQPSSPHLEM